jgi:hypothetical protein
MPIEINTNFKIDHDYLNGVRAVEGVSAALIHNCYTAVVDIGIFFDINKVVEEIAKVITEDSKFPAVQVATPEVVPFKGIVLPG